MKRFWSEYTSHDLARLDRTNLVSVLPVAAIEQHGPHLPLCTDAAILDGLIEAAIPNLPDDLPVLFLPTQSVGKSNEHARYPGTLTLTAETQIRALSEIVNSVAAARVRKLILLNSHGGQISVIDIVARDTRIKHDMLVVAASWFALGLPEGVIRDDERRRGIHAGEMETAMMLALRPDLVVLERARKFESLTDRLERNFRHLGLSPAGRIGWQVQDLNPAGAVGDATAARAEVGQAIIDHVAGAMIELFWDVYRAPISLLHNPTEI